MEQVDKAASGMVLRIVGTILVFTAFLVGSLIYVGFYTSGYSLFQRIVVVLVALSPSSAHTRDRYCCHHVGLVGGT